MHEAPEIIDIGANLAHHSFARDLPEVLARGFAAGVKTIIITGSSVSNSAEAQKIAATHPGAIYSTAGVHPHDSKHCTADTIARLRELAALEEVVAVGECGLDFNRNYSPHPDQEKWFAAQVALAEELEMPLFLHERDARQRFCEILKATRKTAPAVVHCFTGSGDDLRAYLDMDLYIGITGWICDERRGFHLRELIRNVPPNRLMIETDAPYLMPRSMPKRPRDGRNEPAFLPYVVQAVAEALGQPVAEVAEHTTRTAREFFRLR